MAFETSASMLLSSEATIVKSLLKLIGPMESRAFDPKTPRISAEEAARFFKKIESYFPDPAHKMRKLYGLELKEGGVLTKDGIVNISRSQPLPGLIMSYDRRMQIINTKT